jgi:hypothetical protein
MLLLLLLLFLFFLFSYVVYASLLVCKRPSIALGTVIRIILGISIQRLIGNAIAGMVSAATTQDHFGLATASRYLGIRARFTM